MKCPYCNGSGEIQNPTLGALVRHQREKAGLTQEQASRDAGMSRGQLANIETDRTDVPTKTLLRLADAIGCKAGDLLP
jgi:transcriptional regulator with XRE-family HTH domain